MGHSVYVITNGRNEIIGATLPHPPVGDAYAIMVPRPGQKLYHLPDVPKEIVETKDVEAFHASLTTHFNSASGAVEIKTEPRAEFIAAISRALKRAKS